MPELSAAGNLVKTQRGKNDNIKRELIMFDDETNEIDPTELPIYKKGMEIFDVVDQICQLIDEVGGVVGVKVKNLRFVHVVDFIKFSPVFIYTLFY